MPHGDTVAMPLGAGQAAPPDGAHRLEAVNGTNPVKAGEEQVTSTQTAATPTPSQRSAVFSNHVTVANATETYGNTILQYLDRWIPDERSGVFFKPDPFKESAQMWDGVPLVFAQAHPDLALFEENPEAALKAVNGRIVGVARNSRYVQEGHPTLRAALQVTDPEVHDLFSQGKLSLSTAFWAMISEAAIEGGITPNHILLFKEVDGEHMPKDRGALVSNKAESMAPETSQAATTGPEADMTTEVQNAGRVLSRENETFLRKLTEDLTAFLDRFRKTQGGEEDANSASETLTEPGVDTAVHRSDNPEKDANLSTEEEHGNTGVGMKGAESPTTQTDSDLMTAEALAQKDAEIVALKQETERVTADLKQKDSEIIALKATIDEKDAVLKQKDESISALTAELDGFKQKEKDAVFEAWLQSVKPGVQHTDEQKAELRQKFDSDPYGLLLKMPELIATAQGATAEDGSAKVPVGNGTGGKKLGRYNMLTHQWEA